MRSCIYTLAWKNKMGHALIKLLFSCSNLLMPDEVRTKFGFLTNETVNPRVRIKHIFYTMILKLWKFDSEKKAWKNMFFFILFFIKYYKIFISNRYFRRILMRTHYHTNIPATFAVRKRYNFIAIWTWKHVFGNLITTMTCQNFNKLVAEKLLLMDR